MEFEQGSFYIIEFWDHAVGYERPILCHVPGWVVHDARDHVLITTWLVLDEEEIARNNIEPVVIVKSTIQDSYELSGYPSQ